MSPPTKSNDPSSSPVDQDVPYGVRIAAAWAWRLGLILLVSGAILWLLSFITLLVIPIMVAALLAALISPIVAFLRRHRLPKGLAVAVTVVGAIVVITGALTLVGRQMVAGFSALRGQAGEGIKQVQQWLSSGPLQVSAADMDKYIGEGLNALQNNSSSILSGALSVGSSAGHFAAGLLLALFVLVFFLLEGERIWLFLVTLLPQRARQATDGAGRRGWGSMVSYVRIQVLVALIDAVGIGAGAAIIGVPLALPLGVLVLFGSFIPVIGALVTGIVAVLLALVANGWVNALIMLGIVLLVQQAESHLLQPLVMGKAVSLHPVAVILTVAAGAGLAGIPGALFAVPLLAVCNSAVRYIAVRGWEHESGPPGSGNPGALTDTGSGPPTPTALRDIRGVRARRRGAATRAQSTDETPSSTRENNQ
ncbi:AI-2E family transporter [Paenarthrobacter sp. PH39-S1]|uniref:AI-2E family transporter n=1 Tax=Paenarthrobacter sp. PH39-S1 TaxID=3046204 RepID=UPI0024B9939F|nr:AI-2E family transporter [Paenarthrobacter sp. PH39-S1]MDJ0354743.1 AI-2E family transporter [Paenarthrobacter sp. PH39-S1]